MVTRPKVLMLDEPLSALDENLRVRMRGELRKMQKQFGLTFIQVTHHVEEAFSLSDQIVVMDHGHIEQVATPTDLFTTPASRFVAKFIGDNNIFSGKVVGVESGSQAGASRKDLIELSVEGLGSLFCYGTASSDTAAPTDATTAACSVRPDLMTLLPSDLTSDLTSEGAPNNKASPGKDNQQRENQLVARITDVELTGYVTRVALTLEATDQILLYKGRTTDWQRSGLRLGDRITVQWSAKDCVFLPY